MFLLDWYREYREIKNETQICQTCEVLKQQVDILGIENRTLINKLTETKSEVVQPIENPEPIRPRFVPWNVRRQALEAESRRAAQVLASKQKEMNEVKVAPADDPDVKEFEKELDEATKVREN